jgi:fructose-1,6-bisphosphatase/inositol monophosphatase family enzyme
LTPERLHLDLVSEKMLQNSFLKRKEALKKYVNSEHGLGTLDEEEALVFNQEDLTLWIDPLDGTKSFSSGSTRYVTTLIGKEAV